MIGIDGKEKPVFTEGQRVLFNFDGKTKGEGRIRGLAVSHLIDIWIVEVTPGTAKGIDPELYPWSCVTVPHTLLTPLA